MLEGNVKTFAPLKTLHSVEVAGATFYSVGFTTAIGDHALGRTIKLELSHPCFQVYVGVFTKVGEVKKWQVNGYFCMGYCRGGFQKCKLEVDTLPKLVNKSKGNHLKFIDKIEATYELPMYKGHVVNADLGYVVEVFALEKDIVLSYNQGPWT